MGDPQTRELTAAIARGDAAAFEAFYRGWFDRAYARARRLTGKDESFCLDVVQEAMLKAARSMRRMETEADLGRWLSRVVRSAALDRLRSDLRRERREAAVAGPALNGTDPAAEAERRERMTWLESRVAELSEEDRSLLERFASGENAREAGASAGLTEDAAAGRIRRTIERLRAMAKGRFHGAV